MFVCDPIDNREDVHSLIVALMFCCEQLLYTESKNISQDRVGTCINTDELLILKECSPKKLSWSWDDQSVIDYFPRSFYLEEYYSNYIHRLKNLPVIGHFIMLKFSFSKLLPLKQCKIGGCVLWHGTGWTKLNITNVVIVTKLIPCIRSDINDDLLKNCEPSSTTMQGAKILVKQPKIVLAGSLITNFMFVNKFTVSISKIITNTPCLT